MATAGQIAANNRNAQKSTGPKTTAGKEASARNALTRGNTANKYLTSSEDPEEFEALYTARRKLYAADDPIIDGLVEKITFAHFRVDRGFQAEAEMLQQSSLAEVLVHYEKPIKQLSGYETLNRKS
jgi:hypothetical protein